LLELSVITVKDVSAAPGLQSSDLGAIASTFASFAEIMTGFSFAALAIYLAYEYALGRHSIAESPNAMCPDYDFSTGKCKHLNRPRRGQEHDRAVVAAAKHPVTRAEISSTLLYAIVSLAICSFMYASLTSQVDQPRRFSGELLIYGIVFGTSVLALIYAITLMTYTNLSTRDAARSAYWIVVFVGPAVVFRFVAVAAQGALEPWCVTSCGPPHWTGGEITGDVLLVGLPLCAGLVYLLYRRKILDDSRMCGWLCVHVTRPALTVFILAVAVALLSILASEPISPGSLSAFSFVILGLLPGFIVLALFAFVCGCVIGPRLRVLPAEVLLNPEIAGQAKTLTGALAMFGVSSQIRDVPPPKATDRSQPLIQVTLPLRAFLEAIARKGGQDDYQKFSQVLGELLGPAGRPPCGTMVLRDAGSSLQVLVRRDGGYEELRGLDLSQFNSGQSVTAALSTSGAPDLKS
jgi:hypothetical protein